MEIKEHIEALCKRADELCVEYFQRMGYTHSKPPLHQANYISDKWCRVVVMEDRGGAYVSSSVYCFVCLQDGFTRTLGTLKAGDIHKAAGWKAPAKHARGSVFQEDFGKCLTEHGIVYLK